MGVLVGFLVHLGKLTMQSQAQAAEEQFVHFCENAAELCERSTADAAFDRVPETARADLPVTGRFAD